MASTAWWHDFRYANGVMHVKKTGAAVPVEPGVVGDCCRWLVFHACIEAARQQVPDTGVKVWFTPDTPRPWYFVWPVMAMAGLKFARNAGEADIAFVFDDTTFVPDHTLPAHLAVINGRCRDISKTHVAEVFEQVTGRALACDPMDPPGPYVEKSERNGAHDGRILTAPQPRREGYSYQRLINNIDDAGRVTDLRCFTLGGEIVSVFVKRRPQSMRFANSNTLVTLEDPSSLFTPVEQAMIARLCDAMGLDWGGIDVLRDRDTGELWIVDVNKTDMGPTIALDLRSKMFAVRKIAARLNAYIATRRAAMGAGS